MYTETDEHTGKVRIVVERIDEIPASFASEAEAAEWYDTHEFSVELGQQLRARPVPGAIIDVLAQGNPAIAAQLTRATEQGNRHPSSEAVRKERA